MVHFMDLCGLPRLCEAARGGDLGTFSYGAIFAVRHERVVAFLEEAGTGIDKIELLTRADMNYGYMFERVWMHFFGEPFVRLPALDEAPVATRTPAAAVSSTSAPASVVNDVLAGRPVQGTANVEQLRQRAFSAQNAGDVLLATDLLERALTIEPNNHHVVCDLATVALAQNDLRSADSLASLALRMHPDHGTSHYVLAHARVRAGRTDEALPLLRALVQGPAHDSLRAEAPELVAEVTRDLEQLLRQEPAMA
jgi:hypothetical protein